MKCSNTRQGRDAEFLYAYRLNHVAVRNQDLKNIKRKSPCPLPLLDPSKPPTQEVVAVSFDPLNITFWMNKQTEASTLTLRR